MTSPGNRFLSSPLFGCGLGLAAFLCFTGCGEDIECGEGTVLLQGECVPLQMANCTGEGVRFLNGVCVPDDSVLCGPGTVWSDAGNCVPESVPVGDAGGPISDTVTPPDTGIPDLPTSDVPGDVLVSDSDTADGRSEVTDPVDDLAPFVPACAVGLDPTREICVWGQAVDFLTLAPLPGDASPQLEVQVKDLLEAIGNPASAPLADTLVLADGNYLIPSTPISENPLLFIVGEVEAGSPEGVGIVWQRTLSGLVTPDLVRSEYGNTPLFAVPRAAVTSWNATLGLAGAESLEATGFGLIRVVQLVGENLIPLAGATLSCVGECADGATVRYFADAELTSFNEGEGATTGPAGMVLVTGMGSFDNCTATSGSLLVAETTPCGTGAGRASVGVVVMIEL